MNNPYQKYVDQSISTMTPGEMVVQLYEGIIKQLTKGCMCIDESDVKGANEAFQKAQRIIEHLMKTLDFKYEIADNLSELYIFFNTQIFQANMKKEKSFVEDIIPLVNELKEAYAESEKISRM